MNRSLLPRLLPAAAVLLLAGCGRPDATAAPDEHGPEAAGHDHGEQDHDHDEDAAVAFREGQGLRLPAGTADAIGVRTAPVATRPLALTWEVTAAVFEAGPPARASALVPAEVAGEIERHPPAGVRLLAVRRDLTPAINQAELLLELPGQPAAGSTLSLRLDGPAHEVLAIPAPALLRTAGGTFVYLVRDGFLLRTPVRAGAADDTHLEILAGLRAGDVVATAAVEQLWLTELRLTKGGGHSH